ncbi:subfamily M23B non-peptidase homologue (M23 family) [Schistosoma mansoni]|uniref:subfamily M23B non-peptidase homologue (M23 family) n=1 Tax=Schistosoma mansoni TaxID=6183 RepID=UPI0001A64074|nr:subfamily M23B non-peptidase homologue (M23 family) [Schistosoma mansoni]|eukprot:XP_018651935.1 subfamily M23B non-peptidase homologue (M23 family) [Schistosoma mansoni]
MAHNRTELPHIPTTKTSVVSYPHQSIDYIKEIPKCDRQSLVEWRLGVQESITVGILEKISLLKADMIEHLKRSNFLEHEQKSQKDILINEIKTLLQNIEKIDLEVRNFEENVRDKWSTVKDAAVSLKNLENHHLTSLTDVRSRITRCDQAISTLSQRTNQTIEEVRQLVDTYKHDVNELNGHLKLHEHKFAEITNQIDRDNVKFNSAVQRLEETLYKQIADVERRLQQKISELQNEIQVSIQQCQDEKRSLESRLLDSIHTIAANLENRIAFVEEKANELKIDDELYDRVENVEANSSNFKQQVLGTFKEIETRMNKLSDDLYEHHRQTIETVREEMREGFHTMHDTLTSAKSVLENKLRISEETLHMELSQLRKLIVLV